MKGSSSKRFTHAQLCEIAKAWLLRPNSKGGHGCHVALSECRSGYGGEMPDAIGLRAANNSPESVVVEAKVSRTDFLADRFKPHRAPGQGMGSFRYFICPEGLIQPEEVPEKWGLLWVSHRGTVTSILGVTALSNNCGSFRDFEPAWRHDCDQQRELWLVIRVMSRISDPDGVKNTLNKARRENQYLEAANVRLESELKEARSRIASYQMREFATDTHTSVIQATPRKRKSDADVGAEMQLKQA